jgi:hypothetical protein
MSKPTMMYGGEAETVLAFATRGGAGVPRRSPVTFRPGSQYKQGGPSGVRRPSNPSRYQDCFWLYVVTSGRTFQVPLLGKSIQSFGVPNQKASGP